MTTTAELATAICARTGVPAVRVKAVLDALADEIVEGASKGVVYVAGLGSFMVGKVPSRRYKDVRTGAIRTSLPKKKLRFKPASTAKLQ